MEPSDSHTNEDVRTSGFIPFTTSREEIARFAAPLGTVILSPDTITVHQYLYQPSIACKQTTFTAKEIINIDLKAAPPTIRMGNDLIFVPAVPVKELRAFAHAPNRAAIHLALFW